MWSNRQRVSVRSFSTFLALLGSAGAVMARMPSFR
jgi:hypothetical protein